MERSSASNLQHSTDIKNINVIVKKYCVSLTMVTYKLLLFLADYIIPRTIFPHSDTVFSASVVVGFLVVPLPELCTPVNIKSLLLQWPPPVVDIKVQTQPDFLWTKLADSISQLRHVLAAVNRGQVTHLSPAVALCFCPVHFCCLH